MFDWIGSVLHGTEQAAGSDRGTNKRNQCFHQSYVSSTKGAQ